MKHALKHVLVACAAFSVMASANAADLVWPDMIPVPVEKPQLAGDWSGIYVGGQLGWTDATTDWRTPEDDPEDPVTPVANPPVDDPEGPKKKKRKKRKKKNKDYDPEVCEGSSCPWDDDDECNEDAQDGCGGQDRRANDDDLESEPIPTTPVTTVTETVEDYRFADSAFAWGAHIGYNHQIQDQIIIGIEAAFNNVNLSDSYEDQSWEMDWYASITPRLGVLIRPDTMLFVKGGIAWADIGGVEQGWVIGGGVEHQLTENVTIGLQYEHYDISDTTMQAVMARVSYRF